MAENIDLNINIGANVTDLQSQLQKAENLLKQFEAALKKATNVGEINYLNNSIKTLNTQITNLGQQMNKVGRPAADATNALTNLSRVAQDAPYGFIGIANNLNPLLESFQQLQKKSGSASEALKSMAAGLIGPAGIGLALGVVSSLIVTYSDEIAEFFKGPTEKLKKFREELNKLNQDIYKIVGEAQSNRTIGLNLVNVISGGNPTQQQEALKRLKSLYADNKAIKDATVKTDKAYLVHLVNVAAIQDDAAGKEKNTQQILSAAYAERKKIEAQRDADLKNVKTEFGGSAGYNKKKADAERDKISKGYNLLIADLDSVISKAKTKNAELISTLTNIETPSPAGKPPPKPIVDKTILLKEAQDLIRQINKTNKLLTPLEEVIGGDTAIEDLKKQHEDYLKWLTGWTKYKEKLAIDNIDKENKKLEELNKSYEDFAKTMSETVTSAIFSIYDAMQEGATATEALEAMFSRLVRQLAEMAIKAAIFAAIMSAVSGGAGGGGVSFIGAFKKIFGFADGGIVTGPTLGLVGEGSESEAILPLSKLGNIMQGSFNAGSMSGYGGGNGSSVAVLRGQDLLIALNRTQKASSLKGQNISLA
jgi:predicted PurR-regulated permease PerM